MAIRKRNIPLLFWVTEEEKETIQQRMEQIGTKNMSAYLRKMALNGLLISLSIPELKEILTLMRRSSNNLNQLAKRVNSNGRLYDADLEDIQKRQDELWKIMRQLLLQIGKIP